jgi:hypothetical protein
MRLVAVARKLRPGGRIIDRRGGKQADVRCHASDARSVQDVEHGVGIILRFARHDFGVPLRTRGGHPRALDREIGYLLDHPTETYTLGYIGTCAILLMCNP